MRESVKLPTGIVSIFAAVKKKFYLSPQHWEMFWSESLYTTFLLLYLDFMTKINIFIPFSQALTTISYTLCPISFLTATAMTIDRFLTLRLRLRYRNVVNLLQVRVATALCWLIGIYNGLAFLFWSHLVTLREIAGCFVLWTFISLTFYTMIGFIIRKQQPQVHENKGPLSSSSGICPSRLAIYKKRLGAIGFSSLLLSFCNLRIHRNSNKCERRKFQCPVDVSSDFDLLQFFDKSCSLLLENETSKASSEGYGFAVLL